MRIPPSLAIAFFCVSLAACRIPLSKVPLTDDSNSTIDERLLGTWDVDVRLLHAKLGNKDGEPTVRYRVERLDGKANSLIAFYAGGDEKLPIYTTHLAMHDFVSLGGLGGNDQQVFAICLYELDDADTGKLYLMDDTFVLDQVERGKIVAQIDRSGEGIQRILLSEDPAGLRAFIHRAGARAFDLENPLPCRRVKPSVAQE